MAYEDRTTTDTTARRRRDNRSSWIWIAVVAAIIVVALVWWLWPDAEVAPVAEEPAPAVPATVEPVPEAAD